MEPFAFTLPQRNEISIELTEDGYIEITQDDGSLQEDSHNVIKLHKQDLEWLIVGLQEAAKS